MSEENGAIKENIHEQNLCIHDQQPEYKGNTRESILASNGQSLVHGPKIYIQQQNATKHEYRIASPLIINPTFLNDVS